MVAVVRRDDHVRDRLIRDVRDMVDHALGLFDTSLAVRYDDALLGHDEHAHGRESFRAGGAQLLIGVHTRGEFLDAGEVFVRVAASVRISRPDLLIRRDLNGRIVRCRCGLVRPASAAAEGRQGDNEEEG